MGERKPNLFIVGAPRCGTSALQRFLGSHPEVFMPEVKEPHYFSSDITKEGDRYHRKKVFGAFRTLPQYLWLYREATHERFLGDASVLHLYSKVAAEKIASFNPDARIIAMIREPLAFLYSLHARYLYHADEDRESFAKALALEDSRRAGQHIPATVRVPSLLYYSEIAAFSEQLLRYRSVFPQEQIKVIVFDDLAADTDRVHREVLEFLGLEPAAAAPPRAIRRNPNRSLRSRHLAKLLRGFNIQIAQLHQQKGFPREQGLKAPWPSRVLPARAYRALYRHLDRLNTRFVARPELDATSRALAMRRFKPEVERLGELLDRDLVKLWRYDEQTKTGAT